MKVLNILMIQLFAMIKRNFMLLVTNVNMDYLYPEFWAAGFDELDIGEYNLQNFVNRDTQSLLASFGDTVNVPITPDFGEAASWVPGATITPSNTTQTLATVILNQSRQEARGFNDKELSLSKYDLIKSYAAPMAKSILKAVNKSLYLELMKTQYWIDATGGISEDLINDAGTKLSENEVSMGNRRLVASPGVIGAMRKIDVYRDYDTSNNASIIKDGLITRQSGFDIYSNNIISKYTPADLTGAVDVGGNLAAGVTSMVVDAFNDDANPVRTGDLFKFTGQSYAGYYSVVSTLQTAGDTTTIVFTPPLVDATLDNCVITVTPTQSALTFVPSALAFAARAYTSTAKPGVNSSIVDVRGLPVRISTWTDSSTLNLNVAFDILYGQTMVNEKRCVRIIEDI